MQGAVAFRAGAVFDGTTLHHGALLCVEQGRVTTITRESPLPVTDLGPGVIAPAFLDLQVNGGGGQMVDGTATAQGLAAICSVHRRLGTAGILPTLITDTPDATARVIAAGVAAARAKTPGFLGLHLEGPHLDPRRKGAHDAQLIRPMTAADLDMLVVAARDLPALMVTVAPEAATPDQIARLAAAGAIVSLGHSDCSRDTARRAFAAGARCATHLFNAMSPLTNREPGLTGAVLSGDAAAGLIADGIHVDPDTLRIALAARPLGLFLVSDCMAFAGSDMAEITLGDRRILRQDGRLTLSDGTLAGADLTLDRAISVLVNAAGTAPQRALAMASRIPAELIGMADRYGHLLPGRAADFVHLDPGWALTRAWYNGQPA
jgi:N-acetylglucosamine-6-phosphate deacetylase